MSSHFVPVPPVSQHLVPDHLPTVFRITLFSHRVLDDKSAECTACLYHEQACLRVVWSCRQPDLRLHEGALVSIRWQGTVTLEKNCVRINRLVPLGRPVASLDIFDTVPLLWVPDRVLVERAAALLKPLPIAFKQLFNSIFWDDQRFHRFLVGLSSLSGHHNRRNGNFKHCVEVAESAASMVPNDALVCRPLLTLACLLHDAGKADEYVFDNSRLRFDMTMRGSLLGHKQTVVEWIAEARGRFQIEMQETHYLALMHALTAVKGAPAWTGLREPASLEASILSMADRLSGQGDLTESMAPESDGFGGYHKHLNGRPFVVRSPTTPVLIHCSQSSRETSS